MPPPPQTDHVLYKMTDLHFEDEQPLVTKPWIDWSVFGLERFLNLSLPTLKALLNTTGKVKCHKEVGNLSRGGWSSYVGLLDFVKIKSNGKMLF